MSSSDQIVSSPTHRLRHWRPAPESFAAAAAGRGDPTFLLGIYAYTDTDTDTKETPMPVTRIAIREGKTPDYKQALLDEIYEAMRETVQIKEGDRFMAITEHSAYEFAYGPFLGIDRSDELVQIQVFWAPGKTVDAKLAMYRRIVERLGDNPGVRPQDVLISVIETAAENWSFGNGETQFYRPAAHAQ